MTTDDTAPVAQGGERGSPAGAVPNLPARSSAPATAATLKPCPFCGPDGRLLRGIGSWMEKGTHVTKPSVRCATCGASALEEIWNRRSSPSRDAAIEECAQVCDRAHRANLHSIGISMASDARAMMSFKLAEAIRALKAAPVDEVEEQGLAVTSEGTP